MTIRITEDPITPEFGDYDVKIGYGVDDHRNYYELVFTALKNGELGDLESVKNCFTGDYEDPVSITLVWKRPQLRFKGNRA